MVLREGAPHTPTGPGPHRAGRNTRGYRTPYPEDADAKTRNVLQCGQRFHGERGFSLVKERWRVLKHVTIDPGSIGDIMKDALVLTQIEHKVIA